MLSSILEIISCLFTVLALIFSLYLWMLDKMNDDKSAFIDKKKEYLNFIIDKKEELQKNISVKNMLKSIQELNAELEIILNYRFWERSNKRQDYIKIKNFFIDNKYLISNIKRYIEEKECKPRKGSLISIFDFEEEINNIKKDYNNVLSYILLFLENWN